MPAGLFASLAGAACGPMRKACPARSPPPHPARRLCPGGISSGPAYSFRLSAQPAPSRQPPLPRLCRHPPLEQAKTLHLVFRLSPASFLPRVPYPFTAAWLPCAFPLAWPCPVAVHPPIRFLLSGPPWGGASLPALQRQKIVRSTSIFPAISAPLCKEKSFCEKKREHRPIALFFA